MPKNISKLLWCTALLGIGIHVIAHLRHKKAKLLEDTAQTNYGHRLREDALHEAADFQKTFLPQNPLEIGQFQVSGLTRPSDIVNGDFYSFFGVHRRGTIGMAIGDITGHGVQAAIFYTWMQHLFREKSEFATSASETMYLVENSMDKTVLKENRGRNRMLVPATWIEVNVNTSLAKVVRAGHTFPVLIDPEGNCQKITSGRGMLLNSGYYDDMYSETSPDSPWLDLDETEIQIPSGWTLLNFTDGLIETHDCANNLLGEACVFNAIKDFVLFKSNIYTSEELCAMLMTLAMNHKGKAKQHDDITVVAIRNLSA